MELERQADQAGHGHPPGSLHGARRETEVPRVLAATALRRTVDDLEVRGTPGVLAAGASRLVLDTVVWSARAQHPAARELAAFHGHVLDDAGADEQVEVAARIVGDALVLDVTAGSAAALAAARPAAALLADEVAGWADVLATAG